MQYIILAIGDELLAGQVTDTNSGTISRMLESYGWELKRVEVISDSADDLEDAMQRALDEVKVVLTTGGLGPTKDDQTKQTLCRLFGGKLVENRAVLENVKRVISARNLRLNELTARQALVPDNARIIQNKVGTAPILWFEQPADRVVVCMPGVPFETIQMMERKVITALIKRFPAKETLVRHTVMAYDISESALAQILADWEDALPSYAHLAYLPKPGVIRLRLDGRGDESILPEMERLHRELIDHIPPENFLADGDITPEERLLQLLQEQKLTMATAESCTGGTIASRVCAIPGASEAMKGAVVSYSNDVKVNVLGVNPDDLEANGSVSGPVVEQMAQGVRTITGADITVATSGIAGPTGGSSGKPVGTVWMAVASPQGVSSVCNHFPGSRDRVIDRASTAALIALIRELSSLSKR